MNEGKEGDLESKDNEAGKPTTTTQTALQKA